MKQHPKLSGHLIRKGYVMNCYICEKTPGPGGTNYHVKAAVGVCHHCGVGICMEHSHRDAEPGSPLLCPSCAGLLKEESHIQSANAVVSQKSQG